MALDPFTCPRCLGDIPSTAHRGEYPGATSRYDNKTEVCSACGHDEAMRQFGASLAGVTGEGLADVLGWPIVLATDGG